jgi:hypothetical protein
VFIGQLKMNEQCPSCGLKFEREPGYFFGAMYFSYGLGVVMIFCLACIAHWLFPELELQWAAVVGWAAFSSVHSGGLSLFASVLDASRQVLRSMSVSVQEETW